MFYRYNEFMFTIFLQSFMLSVNRLLFCLLALTKVIWMWFEPCKICNINFIFLKLSCFDILGNFPRVGEFVWKYLPQGEKTHQNLKEQCQTLWVCSVFPLGETTNRYIIPNQKHLINSTAIMAVDRQKRSETCTEQETTFLSKTSHNVLQLSINCCKTNFYSFLEAFKQATGISPVPWTDDIVFQGNGFTLFGSTSV